MGITIVSIVYEDQLGVERLLTETAEEFCARAERLELRPSPVSTLAEITDAVEKNTKMLYPNRRFELTVTETKWNKHKYAVFAEEAEAAGFDVIDYCGRGFYEGPAIQADYANEVTGQFSMPLTIDSLGHGIVAYPK